MLTKKYLSEVVSITNTISGVYTIEFKSLNGKFKYQSGQFLHLAINSEYDGIGQWPESRCFSIQSNPSEENIKITYSVKGPFTTSMEYSLKIGTKVWLKLPYGDLFTQNHTKINNIFISGGTGITPYLSLFTSSEFANYKHPILYAGYKSRRYFIYEKELEKAKVINSEFVIKNFFEDCDGKININNIYNENRLNSIFFISGPPEMIKSFKISLTSLGVSKELIFTDDWE